PPTAADPLETIQMQTHALPPRLADLAPGNYGRLEDVVERALAKAPGDRYPSAVAMSEALDLALAGGTKPSDTAVMRLAAESPTPSPPRKPIVRPTAPRSAWPIIVLVLLVLAAAAIATTILLEKPS